MTAGTDTIEATEVDDAPPGAPPERPVADRPEGRGSVGKALVAMVLVAAALGAVILFVANRDTPGVATPFEVEVPTDAGAAIVAGDGEDLVPALIRLQPGQQLVLQNEDWGPHTLGPLTAERGQTVRSVYATEGRHITSTTLREDGRVTILVEDTTR